MLTVRARTNDEREAIIGYTWTDLCFGNIQPLATCPLIHSFSSLVLFDQYPVKKQNDSVHKASSSTAAKSKAGSTTSMKLGKGHIVVGTNGVSQKLPAGAMERILGYLDGMNGIPTGTDTAQPCEKDDGKEMSQHFDRLVLKERSEK